MNEEIYTAALKTALTEIENNFPEMQNTFILMNKDTLISGNEQNLDPKTEKVAKSLKCLTEQTASIGGLEGLSIEGENGKIHACRIGNLYFVTSMSKKTDLSNFRAITGVALPTIIKVLESIPLEAAPPPAHIIDVPSAQSSVQLNQMPSEPMVEEETVKQTVEETEEALPQQEQEALEPETPEGENETEYSKRKMPIPPSQQFIVEKLGGFMIRSDTVQIDLDALQRWSAMLNDEEISEVDLETFGGKTARCKTKVMSDTKFSGRGLIRIPEKLCSSLDLKKGELVRVNPVCYPRE